MIPPSFCFLLLLISSLLLRGSFQLIFSLYYFSFPLSPSISLLLSGSYLLWFLALLTSGVLLFLFALLCFAFKSWVGGALRFLLRFGFMVWFVRALDLILGFFPPWRQPRSRSQVVIVVFTSPTSPRISSMRLLTGVGEDGSSLSFSSGYTSFPLSTHLLLHTSLCDREVL
ncbi:hypothetical protein BJ508DRAFT_131453 [Ascobolus immersus RN42]|uniref:Uncharacterized protein n=1 Tax=Ascobolus immersus RN42 TaxID=1160509 RepID=A0A3N4IEP0_ASCIM|nr:hypothetical protein BJ508DRAFT_131453 [Ascobolus immersus RN42]